MAEQLRIGKRKLWMHKCIVQPNFATEHVLSRDPWLYVELWLKRQKSESSLAYWSQARRFAEASADLAPEAAPLTLYYAFLNATKALLTHKSLGAGKQHGVAGARPPGARAKLSNEEVSFKSSGVLTDLCAYLGESTTGQTYSLRDILWNIPFVHRAFLLTYTSSAELLIPLEDARYVKKANSTEAWFEAKVVPRFSDNRMLSNIPSSFEIFRVENDTFVRRKKRFRWTNGRTDLAAKDAALGRLATYHSRTRRVVVNISGVKDLWYLKRHNSTNAAADRHVLTLMFAAMHRLSELSRYDPHGFERHLAGRANWLLTEFIQNGVEQFIDQIASEITGCQFWVPKVR